MHVAVRPPVQLFQRFSPYARAGVSERARQALWNDRLGMFFRFRRGGSSRNRKKKRWLVYCAVRPYLEVGVQFAAGKLALADWRTIIVWTSASEQASQAGALCHTDGRIDEVTG